MAWADQAARLDEAVDDKLGDTISYADDGSSFVDIPGFVWDAGELPEGSPIQIDPLRQGKRVKIRQALIDKPHKLARLRHARLGSGTFRPTNSEPSNQGRYWIFEVEPV